MRKALLNLMQVTRKYVAPGVKEVDDALEAAAVAYKRAEELAKALGLRVKSEPLPANEGLNGRGPTWL